MTSGQTSPLDIALDIAAAAAQVDVTSTTVGAISVDPSQNAGAIVLSETDLDALPDDPDDLAAQLTAMAGPSAGPNGAQIFVDGFSGGQIASEEFDSRNPHQLQSVRLGIRQPWLRTHSDLHQARHG